MHSIRLRGPWELSLPGSDQPLRVDMPATWESLLALTEPAAPLPSPARLVRRFGKPTGLEAHDRLHLVIDGASADLQVELNGQPLGRIPTSQDSCSFEITALLNSRNELLFLLPIPSRELAREENALLWQDVRLDIAVTEE